MASVVVVTLGLVVVVVVAPVSEGEGVVGEVVGVVDEVGEVEAPASSVMRRDTCPANALRLVPRKVSNFFKI